MKTRFELDNKITKDCHADKVMLIPSNLIHRFEHRKYLVRNGDMYNDIDIIKVQVKRMPDYIFFFRKNNERPKGIPRRPEEWDF